MPQIFGYEISLFWIAIPVIILLILIWFKLDYTTKKKITETFTIKRIGFIAFFLGWYLWNKYGSSTTLKNANIWMPIIGLGIIALMNYFGVLRYKTRQVITPNYHGSFARDPIRVNGFLIFAVGSFNSGMSGGIDFPFAQEVLVVKEETGEMLEDGFISIARVSPVSINDLDTDVKLTIERTKILSSGRKSIYYGWFDNINEVDWNDEQLEELEKMKSDKTYGLIKRSFGVDNPSIKELFRTYLNACKGKNKTQELFDEAVEDIEKGVEHHRRVKDAYIDKRQPEKTEGFEESA